MKTALGSDSAARSGSASAVERDPHGRTAREDEMREISVGEEEKKKKKKKKKQKKKQKKRKREQSSEGGDAAELERGAATARRTEADSAALPKPFRESEAADDAEAARKAAKAAKAARKSMAKKARRAERAALAARVAADLFPKGTSPPVFEPSAPNKFGHLFSSEYNDHFETPFCAYADLAPLLRMLNAKTKTIYDPFFCKGSMVKHLASLGFKNVINRNEDFWAVLKSGKLPAFDITVTNPPYSDEDKERTVKFIVASRKPGFVLIPSYCANKSWFKRAVRGREQKVSCGADGAVTTSEVFVVRPTLDYQYAHIEGKGHRASPFHSSWFCFNMPFRESVECMANSERGPVVCPVSELKKVGVQFKKRLNPRQRKKRKAGSFR